MRIKRQVWRSLSGLLGAERRQKQLAQVFQFLSGLLALDRAASLERPGRILNPSRAAIQIAKPVPTLGELRIYTHHQRLQIGDRRSIITHFLMYFAQGEITEGAARDLTI